MEPFNLYKHIEKIRAQNRQVLFYRRVSSVQQNLYRQDIDDVQFDRVFEEKASAKGDSKRPILQEAIAYCREGDLLIFYSIDRAARSLSDLQKILSSLVEKGVTVYFYKERLDFSKDEANPFSVLQLQMMGAFCEFERNILLERQREGIAKARARGRYDSKLNDATRNEIRKRYAAGEGSMRVLAKEYGVSATAISKIVNADNEPGIENNQAPAPDMM